MAGAIIGAETAYPPGAPGFEYCVLAFKWWIEIKSQNVGKKKLNPPSPPDGQLKIILLLLEVRGYSDCFLSNIITPKQEVFYVNFATANIPAGGITGGIGSSFFFHESIPPLFVALMQFVACRIWKAAK